MMERMTSRVNRTFSASRLVGAVNPWGDAQAESLHSAFGAKHIALRPQRGPSTIY